MAPWRFNFLPWGFSKCRDALGNPVTFLTISWCFRTTLASCCDVQRYRLGLAALLWTNALPHGSAWSSVRMPSGHMMSRGQALLAGLSECGWLHAPSKQDTAYYVVRWRNVDLMLVHCLQRWLNFKASCSTCRVCHDNRAYAWCVTILYRVYTNPTSTQRWLLIGNEACWLRYVVV